MKKKRSKERAQARAPGTRPEELRSLAVKYPDEVLSNPVLPLIALESPALFAEIKESAEEIKRERWLLRHLKEATPKERRLFEAYCAELVLPMFEEVFPEDARPKRAVEIARLYAAGESTEEDLHEARREVRAMIQEAQKLTGEERQKAYLAIKAAKAAEHAVEQSPVWSELGRIAMAAAALRAHAETAFSHPKHQNPITAAVEAGRKMRKKQAEWLQKLVASR